VFETGAWALLLNKTLIGQVRNCPLVNKKKLLVVAIILIGLVVLTVSVYYFVTLSSTAKPSWLKSDSYMVYEQKIEWQDHNETEYMTWNATGMDDVFVNLHLLSHGVNVTSGQVEITEGEADFSVNMFTREIISCSDASYVGKKWMFWIPTDVNLGSTVNIVYGVTTISGSESVNVLGQSRDCWVLQYDWTTADMKRWYDKKSGICLKIQVTLNRDNIIITTTETAVTTNISLA
jgi:hypothetical protein